MLSQAVTLRIRSVRPVGFVAVLLETFPMQSEAGDDVNKKCCFVNSHEHVLHTLFDFV